ncbi:PBPe domain-containing protein [Candida albicans]
MTVAFVQIETLNYILSKKLVPSVAIDNEGEGSLAWRHLENLVTSHLPFREIVDLPCSAYIDCYLFPAPQQYSNHK